jgi:hypothetical protein
VNRWPLIRDIALFVIGLSGVTVLTVAWLKGRDPNAQLMLLFAAMCGVPAFLRSDERKDKDG